MDTFDSVMDVVFNALGCAHDLLFLKCGDQVDQPLKPIKYYFACILLLYFSLLSLISYLNSCPIYLRAILLKQIYIRIRIGWFGHGFDLVEIQECHGTQFEPAINRRWNELPKYNNHNLIVCDADITEIY